MLKKIRQVLFKSLRDFHFKLVFLHAAMEFQGARLLTNDGGWNEPVPAFDIEEFLGLSRRRSRLRHGISPETKYLLVPLRVAAMGDIGKCSAVYDGRRLLRSVRTRLGFSASLRRVAIAPGMEVTCSYGLCSESFP